MVARPARSDTDSRRHGRSRRAWTTARLAAPALLALIAGAARAQATPPPPPAPEDVPVLQRPRPEWQPTGLPVGAFTVLPSVTLTAERDDNILASQTGAIADALFVISPQLLVQSNWNQNALVLFGGANVDRYAENPQQDTYQYSLKADGTLNVRRDLTVTGEAFYSTTALPRTTDAYYQDSVIPLLVDETSANVNVTKSFDKFQVSANADVQRYAYSNGASSTGAVLSEAYRDSTSYIGTVRGVYTFSPNRSIFIEQSLTHTVYTRASYRDQDVYETLVGPDLQLTHLLKAEVGVGYLQGSFSQADAPTIRSFTGRAQITYFPTQLITLTLTAHQHVFDSGDPLSPAYLQRQVSLEADYELLRNVILSLTGNEIWNNYRGIDRQDTYPGVTFNAAWLVNRGLSVNLAYYYLQRTSTGLNAVQGFVDDRVALGVTLQR